MKRTGILLALLMLFGTLAVGETVGATAPDVVMRAIFTLSDSYDADAVYNYFISNLSKWAVDEATRTILWEQGSIGSESYNIYVSFDGQNIIISSDNLGALFLSGTNEYGDSTTKATSIANSVLSDMQVGGFVSATTSISSTTYKSGVAGGMTVYVFKYLKEGGDETIDFNAKLSIPKIYAQVHAFGDGDSYNYHNVKVEFNIYDSVSEDSSTGKEISIYTDGRVTEEYVDAVDVSTWQSYIQNREVGLYWHIWDTYTDTTASLSLRVIVFSDAPNLDYEDYMKFDILPDTVNVYFSLHDALTNQPLSGVTVKEGDTTLGTIDDGGSLELAKGTHELVFEKQGYWSVTKTIDVQGDMTVSVEMYPSSAAFKLENFPANISIPENTIYTLTFTLSPVDTSATYNTYLSLSGLSDVLEVRKDGSAISPESGKYYLGDVSGPTQVSIKFKAGAVGQHGFTLTLTSNDAIMSKTYTTTKQVTYTVEPLPFSVQMPSEWQVGQNELRISESSGQSYLITAVLKDSQGNEVWSESYSFSPYEAYTFSINVPSEGTYTLELTWNSQTAVYDITVNPAISLKTKTLTVSEGGEGTIVLHFENPSSDVQYYTVKVSGGFLPKEINQSISVAPLTEKDVSITFAVPEDLTYDAYELNVQVLQGNATVFSDKVAVSISEGSGFSLFGGASSGGKTLYYGLAALVGLGLFIAILRRR